MNKLTYIILNKLNDKSNNSKKIDEYYLEILYQFYEYRSQILNYEIYIEKNEFERVLRVIYNVLILKIEQKEVEKISEHYVKLLMADAKDGHLVDVSWFINYIWYLCVGISGNINTENYKNCIPFIQQQLIEEFNIEENIKDKVKRKIYTRIMIGH